MGQAALFHRRIDEPLGYSGWPAQPPAELRLLCQVVDTLQDPVAVTAPPTNGQPLRLLYANPAFRRLAGQASDDPTVADGALIESIKESHRHGDTYAVELSCLTSDGSRKVLRLRSEPVRNEAGSITHRIATFRDATAESNLEESLRRNERLACIGLLGTGIAHEINNPAGAALLAAETALSLVDAPDAREQVNACLHNIIASMDRCGRIVRTLLRYSRQEPTERQACSLNDVVEQAVELARPYAESRGAELRVTHDPNLPLAPMNPLEIELVLINLIRNAAEAGQVNAATITIHTAFTEYHARAVVADDGCGMNEEQLAQVFEPLYTTRRQAGGSGLGMGIAKGIVLAHSGRMEVRSRLGAGTTVVVELPLK